MSLTEEYRPRSFDSPYLIKTKPIRTLEQRVDVDREIPHLLLAGDAGLGKTTIAHMLIRKICNIGEDVSISDYCLDLNASDERGIDVVRGKIKDYARSLSLFSNKRYIYMDEMDNLTFDAQSALRRTMEDYWDTCTFILSCNYPHKIIDAIQSRCSIFNFPKPDTEDLFKLVKLIVENEKNINITDDAIYEIIRQTGNDIRATINYIDGHSVNLLIEKSDIQIVDKSHELIDVVCDGTIEEIQDFFRTDFDVKNTVSNLLKPIDKRLFDNKEYVGIVSKLADVVYRVKSLSKTDGKLQLYSFCIKLHSILLQCSNELDNIIGVALDGGSKGDIIDVLTGVKEPLTSDEVDKVKELIDKGKMIDDMKQAIDIKEQYVSPKDIKVEQTIITDDELDKSMEKTTKQAKDIWDTLV